jgi:hypothetical protein
MKMSILYNPPLDGTDVYKTYLTTFRDALEKLDTTLFQEHPRWLKNTIIPKFPLYQYTSAKVMALAIYEIGHEQFNAVRVANNAAKVFVGEKIADVNPITMDVFSYYTRLTS